VRDRLRKNDEEQGALDFEEIILEEEYVLPRPLKLGDRVYMVSFGQEGEVVALPDKDGNVQVKAGILNAKTPLTKLRLLEKYSGRDEAAGRNNFEAALKKLAGQFNEP
jgi:DNA mismatch repair protein MutS2